MRTNENRDESQPAPDPVSSKAMPCAGALSPKRTTNTSADKDCPCAGLDYRVMRKANRPSTLTKVTLRINLKYLSHMCENAHRLCNYVVMPCGMSAHRFSEPRSRMLDMDNWDEVKTALHVARIGTVSGAAEVLGRAPCDCDPPY
jgi:hypothetical protein